MKDNKPTILVTGANGQLGNELKSIAVAYPDYHFIFTSREELLIEDQNAVKNYFSKHKVDHCINTAAYTAVDKAESEKEKAFRVNATAAGDLAAICKVHNTQLIHISTDYVFDGTANEPYAETAPTHPINIYGASKLKGEELVLQNAPSAVIIRTSWVYSSFGNNFVKTMLRLMKEKESINVVNDQFGCPTYAADLAQTIMTIIEYLSRGRWPVAGGDGSIFNYCSSGIINWYEFASAIKEITGSKCIVNPIPTSQYPTMAKRPLYSVLDTTAIRETLQITIPEWKESLEKCLAKINASG